MMTKKEFRQLKMSFRRGIISGGLSIATFTIYFDQGFHPILVLFAAITLACIAAQSYVEVTHE